MMMNEITLSMSRVRCCAATTEWGRLRPLLSPISVRTAETSRSRSMFALLLATVALTGCARFEPKPLSSAATAARLENRSLTNTELRAFVEQNLHREVKDWPPPNWDFEMLTLAALYYHPSLDVARAQWQVTQGAERTAAQRPNPSLNITPGYDTTTVVPSPWIPLTYLDIPIETAGKRPYRRAEAASLTEAARLNLATVAWQLRSRLRLSLLEYDTDERRLGLLERQLAVQQQILHLLEQQLQAGAVATSELLPSRIGLIKLRLDLADAQRSRADARARVAEALGVPVRALEEIKLSLDSLVDRNALADLSSAQVRQTALTSRPDILGALAEYAASQASLQLEIAKQYPDIRLQPGYQYDQADSKWSLGIVVDLPIFHQNQGPIAEAKGRREAAAARFIALQASVLAELDRATDVLRTSEQTAATLRSLAEAQAQRRDSVAAQFQAGAADQLEVLSTQSESVAAELVQLDGELKFHQAAAAMEDAVQRPFQFPAAAFESTRTDLR
jgi:cobalt-zinc-cadmium efflux system outer membrane protein